MYDSIWLADGVMRKIIFIIFDLIKAVIVYRITASPTLNPPQNVCNLTLHCDVLGDLSKTLSQPTTSGAQEEIGLFSFHVYLNRFFLY